jgi:hypothetical protein
MAQTSGSPKALCWRMGRNVPEGDLSTSQFAYLSSRYTVGGIHKPSRDGQWTRFAASTYITFIWYNIYRPVRVVLRHPTFRLSLNPSHPIGGG